MLKTQHLCSWRSKSPEFEAVSEILQNCRNTSRAESQKHQEANSQPVEEELGRIEVSARCRCCVEAQLGTWTWSGTEQSRWWWLSPSQTIFDGPSASLWCQFLVYFCVVPSASSNVDHSVKRFQEILDNWFQDSKLARDTIPSKHLYKPDKSQEARIGLVIILDVPDVEIENKSSLGRCHCWGKLLTGSNRWLPASCPAALVNVAWSPFAISSPAIYTHLQENSNNLLLAPSILVCMSAVIWK